MDFRPAQAEDAAEIAQLLNAVRHFPLVTPADCVANLQKGPGCHAWVAREGGQTCYVQTYLHPYGGQMFWLACRPADSLTLVESCLDFIEEWAKGQFLLLASDKFPTLLTSLDRRDYLITSEEIPQSLDLTEGIDRQQGADLLGRLRKQGFEFHTMDEVASRSGVVESLHALELEVARDVPRAVVRRQPTLSEFRQRLTEYQQHDRYWALVLHQAEVVASSQHLQRGPDYFYSFGTGVRRTMRGRGLALAAKVLALERIQASGATRVDTSNEVENRAMLHINQKLGFRPLGRQFYYLSPL
ncbi:MAG: hypothetical protein U0931_29730 [Vulcanimicrobiota bacterium]